MLKVKTRIGNSKVHGIGLFADQLIPAGTITWEYTEDLDLDVAIEIIEAMDELNKKYFFYYCYFDKKRDCFILCADNQRFINHTSNKKKENILSTPDQDIAIRDILPGEELLCDYNKFDDNYFRRMNINPRKLK